MMILESSSTKDRRRRWGIVASAECCSAIQEKWDPKIFLLSSSGNRNGLEFTRRDPSLEIWYVQGLVLVSGLLPNPTIALDSLSISLNYWTWDIEFMLGLSAAVSVRVSNELGAGHPMVAKFSVIVANMTTILISAFLCAIVLVFRVGLSQLFTSDEEVIAAVSNLTPLLAISVFLNGVQPILSGVAIGSGWQGVVAYVNLTTYYIIGLPIGCVLGFKTSLGAAGIWWGMILGVVLQTATLIFITARTNWNAEVIVQSCLMKSSVLF
ncbi:hypothetical protein RHSIM_Rhsim13G0195900 [Rhododendron simsii]|uniref:Uncharacterized protein n=1 Tax=Rhododendron simsii TaxID=118357 RepID=A0A834FXN6_RHOSS|nr:hypothetical protein RHSIM_Rhsim13G0195900 [Rhododendron simsii]